MSKKTETDDERENREFKETMQSVEKSLDNAFKLTGSKADGEHKKLFGFLEKEKEPIKTQTQTKPKPGFFRRIVQKIKNLFSSSSKKESTKSNKVATPELKHQTKPEDLSKIKKSQSKIADQVKYNLTEKFKVHQSDINDRQAARNNRIKERNNRNVNTR